VSSNFLSDPLSPHPAAFIPSFLLPCLAGETVKEEQEEERRRSSGGHDRKKTKKINKNRQQTPEENASLAPKSEFPLFFASFQRYKDKDIKEKAIKRDNPHAPELDPIAP